jgi:hypothetical protein
MTFTRVSLAAVSFAFLALPLFGGEASGKFKAGRMTITPKAATAYESREQGDARKKSVEVMLAVAPLDLKEIASALDPHVVAINSDAAKEGDYILLWIRQDGRVSMNATFSSTMSQYIDTTDDGLKAELTENTPQKVAGRVWTSKPVKTMSGETYELDVTFAADVTRSPAGTKLPADGGEPGKAFKALYGAVAKKNWDGIKAGVSPGRMSMLDKDYNTPEENLADAVDTLGNYWLPKKHKIVGGELRGDVAILEVEGEIYEGAKALYLVQMLKGENGWQYDYSVPAGMLK